jgi:hypothetical protein
MLLKGIEFNKIFEGINFYKINRNPSLSNDDFYEYKQGLNIYESSHKHKLIGGIYFILGNHIERYIPISMLTATITTDKTKKSGKIKITHDIWNVIVPDDADVEISDYTIKTNKIILTTKLTNYKDIQKITQFDANKLFKIKPELFLCFSDDLKTSEMCEKIINYNANMFKHVPHNFITQKMCENAVDQNVNIFEYIPWNFVTFEMCEKVVNHNINMFEHIPDIYKTRELCANAFSRDVHVIKYIPDEYITDEMLKTAFIYT